MVKVSFFLVNIVLTCISMIAAVNKRATSNNEGKCLKKFENSIKTTMESRIGNS